MAVPWKRTKTPWKSTRLWSCFDLSPRACFVKEATIPGCRSILSFDPYDSSPSGCRAINWKLPAPLAEHSDSTGPLPGKLHVPDAVQVSRRYSKHKSWKWPANIVTALNRAGTPKDFVHLILSYIMCTGCCWKDMASSWTADTHKTSFSQSMIADHKCLMINRAHLHVGVLETHHAFTTVRQSLVFWV